MQNIPISDSLNEFHAKAPVSKADPKYGAELASKIYDSIKTINGYYARRNERISINRQFARGQHNMKQFLDMLGIDGKNSFANLDTEAPKFMPKMLEILIGRFMEYEETPNITAVDDISKSNKELRKRQAEWRMNMQPLISGLEQQSGMPLEDPNAYVPEDKEDMEIYFELEDYDEIEVKFQKVIKDVMLDSSYQVNKRRLLTDLIHSGFCVAKVERDCNGVIRWKPVLVDDMFYTYCQMDDFSDCKMMGELQKMRIADAREAFPHITEQKWFEMYKLANQDTYKHDLSWDNSYQYSFSRPYDDAVVEFMNFTLISTEERYWVEGKDRYSKATIDEKKNKPVYFNRDGSISSRPVGKDKAVINKRIRVVYEGVYSTKTREMIKWGVMKEMIKPHYALHEVFGPYCIVMPDQIDMENVSMVERARSDIKAMTLARLKLQQIVARLKPEGIAVDIDGLTGVDIGLGKESSPMELQSIYEQTGVLYYTRMDEEGERSQNLPILTIDNANGVTKIQALINTYNFHLQSLRDVVGTNEITEGQAPNPRMGRDVLNNSVNLTNRATHFIYEAYINILEQIGKRIAVLSWFDVVDGKYKMDYGLQPSDILERIFDLRISMLPTPSEINYIEELVRGAIAAKIINLDQAFKVRRIAKMDIKLAERTLARYEKSKVQQEVAINQSNMQLQNDLQEAANMRRLQAEAQNKQLEMEGKAKVQKEASKDRQSEFIESIIVKMLDKGGKIPPVFEPIVAQYLKTVMGNLQLTDVNNELDMALIMQALQGGQEQQEV
jgi:hypothetical protein